MYLSLVVLCDTAMENEQNNSRFRLKYTYVHIITHWGKQWHYEVGNLKTFQLVSPSIYNKIFSARAQLDCLWAMSYLWFRGYLLFHHHWSVLKHQHLMLTTDFSTTRISNSHSQLQTFTTRISLDILAGAD